jgi:ribulose-5-phosphate 4-epimerase/fuculose-1-phosphate aldolase
MLTSMGDLMREAHARGWITTRDGNVSVRRKDSFYITPSGGRKVIIHPEFIIKYKLPEDRSQFRLKNLFKSDKKPSGEFDMHVLLQTTDCFKGCRSVVHLHPTYTIAAMHAGFDLQKLAAEFPEVSRYTRVGPNVPVLPVTSEVLAEATFNAMTSLHEGCISILDFDIVGQAGHGVCAIGKSPWDAFEHIERLEHICQIVLASGVSPK